MVRPLPVFVRLEPVALSERRWERTSPQTVKRDWKTVWFL